MNTINMILASGFWSGEHWQKIWSTILDWCMSFGKNILIAVVILIVGNKLIKWVLGLISKSFAKAHIEEIVGKFLTSLIKFALYAMLAIVVIGILGVPATSFVAVFSAVGLTVGLALQGSLSNFAGGVLILLFKPFKIGDYIKEDNHANEGTVVGIDLFYTKLKTVDNKIVVVPNGALANASLTNFTSQNKRRVDILVGVSYDSDIKKAKEIITNLLEEQQDILRDEGINVYVDALAESQITIGVRVWTPTDKYWDVKWALLEKIKYAFDANGIEIPYNQLAVTLKK